MKNKLSSLGRVLSKAQLKQINGGYDRCAYYNGETGHVTYHLTSSQAQSMLRNASDHWCCNSCNTASWYNGRDAFETLTDPR